jgi:hypothetical protein
MMRTLSRSHERRRAPVLSRGPVTQAHAAPSSKTDNVEYGWQVRGIWIYAAQRTTKDGRDHPLGVCQQVLYIDLVYSDYWYMSIY